MWDMSGKTKVGDRKKSLILFYCKSLKHGLLTLGSQQANAKHIGQELFLNSYSATFSREKYPCFLWFKAYLVELHYYEDLNSTSKRFWTFCPESKSEVRQKQGKIDQMRRNSMCNHTRSFFFQMIIADALIVTNSQ